MQKSNEWYTPAKYIEAARAAMGSIDLDPASCTEANKIVQATTYYTQKEDGLLHPWHGNVYLNPPYSSLQSPTGLGGPKRRGPTHLFVAKLLKEFVSGQVKQAIVCVNADINRKWFQCFWPYTICFMSHPIHFYKPDSHGQIQKDSRNSHFFGSCFIYLGLHEQRFIEHFRDFGPIVHAVTLPTTFSPQPSLLSV